MILYIFAHKSLSGFCVDFFRGISMWCEPNFSMFSSRKSFPIKNEKSLIFFLNFLYSEQRKLVAWTDSSTASCHYTFKCRVRLNSRVVFVENLERRTSCSWYLLDPTSSSVLLNPRTTEQVKWRLTHQNPQSRVLMIQEQNPVRSKTPSVHLHHQLQVVSLTWSPKNCWSPRRNHFIPEEPSLTSTSWSQHRAPEPCPTTWSENQVPTPSPRTWF